MIYFVKLKKFDLALPYYKKWLKLHPEDIQSWLEKGTSLEKLERYQEAIECYNKVIEKNPECFLAYYQKGFATEHLPDGIRYKNKMYIKKAIDCYTEALKINPTNKYTHYLMGICYINLDKCDEALLSLKKAQGLDNNELVYASMGIVLENLKRYDESTSSYGHAAFLSFKNGKLEFAKKYFEKTFSMHTHTEHNICYECGIVLAAIYCLEGKLYDSIISVCEKYQNNICSSAKAVFDFLVLNKKSKIENIQNEKDFTFKDLMDKIMKYYSS